MTTEGDKTKVKASAAGAPTELETAEDVGESSTGQITLQSFAGGGKSASDQQSALSVQYRKSRPSRPLGPWGTKEETAEQYATIMLSHDDRTRITRHGPAASNADRFQ